MEIGCIGLGKMGLPMARRLLENQDATRENTVHLFNRSPDPVNDLVRSGGRPARSASEVAERADIVLTVLPTPESVERVYEEMSAVARPGQTFVDHSTVSPHLSRRCAELVEGRGARFLDAPVSGGPEGAAAGTLTVMAGGEAGDLDSVRPVLECFARNVKLCGPVGSGQVVKLVNQLLVGIHTAAIAEAAVFGTALGADAGTLLDIISTSYGGSVMVERNLPRFIRRDFEAGGTVNILLKDLGLIADEAQTLEMPLRLGATASQLFHEARRAGLNGKDISSVVQVLEGPAHIQVR